jgi:aspartate/methionine/tyrosine aminotransferase
MSNTPAVTPDAQAARALQVARRVGAIAPFHVMEVVKAASALARAGADVISMSVGEPDFTATELVQQAAIDAIRSGATQYTDALGMGALREAIAAHYDTAFGIAVDPRRIVVTAGASAGLLLACAALVGEGDEVLMPDPCYPCNRHFVSAFGGRPVLVPADASQRYQLTAADVDRRWRRAPAA